MFKLGFLKSGGAVIPDVTPNPVNFDSLFADNTLALTSGTYLYMAQQITGINVPITLNAKTNLDPTYGHVYYKVANTFPTGTFQSNDGPLSGIYGTFTQIPGAVAGIPYNTLTPVSFTINPNQWLILAVDGNTATTTVKNFIGELRNIADSNVLLSAFTGSYYNLRAGIMNPLNFGAGPGYDSSMDPDFYFYSTSALVSGIIAAGTVDIDISYTDPMWDTVAQLYYKVTTTPPTPHEQWSSIDPASIGYTPVTSGDKIFGAKNGDYITFAVAGKVTPGTVSITVDLNNVTTSGLLASFSASANVSIAP